MEAKVSHLLMIQKYINSKQFKAIQNSEIKDDALCLGNISQEFL